MNYNPLGGSNAPHLYPVRRSLAEMRVFAKFKATEAQANPAGPLPTFEDFQEYQGLMGMYASNTAGVPS